MGSDTKDKAAALGQMAFGAAKVVGGVMTATGHGLVGGFCRSHHLAQVGLRIGGSSVKSGTEHFKQGLKRLKGE